MRVTCARPGPARTTTTPRVQAPARPPLTPRSVNALTDVHLPFVDLIDRQRQPRMPWHDVQAAVTARVRQVCGDPVTLPQNKCAKDFAASFIEKWNFVRRDDGVETAYPAIDRFAEYKHREVVAQWTALLAADASFATRPVGVLARCQALRSITRWSGGRDSEASIGAAYISLIEEAQHFIYIENQYFISSRISASRCVCAVRAGGDRGAGRTTARQAIWWRGRCMRASAAPLPHTKRSAS